MLEWMVWTPQTMAVFLGLAVMLLVMGLWARVSPPVARSGFLRMETDRGDRLYIGLILAALVLVLWIALTSLSMWLALAVALAVATVIWIWG